jgi:heme exporter protein C
VPDTDGAAKGVGSVKRQLQVAIILAIVGGVLTTAAFLMAFTTARVQTFGTIDAPAAVETTYPPAPAAMQPTDGTGVRYQRPWLSQKIFYFHVPIAEASFLVFTLAAIFAVLFLVKRKQSYDTRSRIGMETTLVFTIGTMITGVMWTRASWLTNWSQLGREMLSEPRLATYTIMLVFVIAYFVLRNSVEDPERRAVYSAVFTIIAWIDAPISFFITRMVPSNHPIVFQSGMDTTNLIPFIIAQIGMLMLGYAIYALRVAEESSRDTLTVLKEQLEG